MINMQSDANVVIATVLVLSLSVLFVFGVMAFCRPKKKASEMVSTREHEESTARTANQRKKRDL